MPHSNSESAVPEWFIRALHTPFESQQVDVEGCPIHFLTWGERNRPGLLFVHGGLAHAHWWRFIAPFFSNRFRCAALDLSGHGESGWRSQYRTDLWVREILAVQQSAHFNGKSLLVGHSMGGLLAAGSAVSFGNHLIGAIIDDAPIHNPFGKISNDDHSPINAKIYASEALAISRFRLLPNQPVENHFILDFLARTSMMPVEGGWRWKFDPDVFNRLHVDRSNLDLRQAACPVLLIRGEKSRIVPPEIEGFCLDSFTGKIPLVTIPEAYHHVPIDQPLALIAAIQTALGCWLANPAPPY